MYTLIGLIAVFKRSDSIKIIINKQKAIQNQSTMALFIAKKIALRPTVTVPRESYERQVDDDTPSRILGDCDRTAAAYAQLAARATLVSMEASQEVEQAGRTAAELRAFQEQYSAAVRKLAIMAA